MFTVTNNQLEQLALGRLDKVVKKTWTIAEEEFTEFLSGNQEADRLLIKKQIHKAYYMFRISSFDALEDFALLSLQYPVLLEEPLPADLMRIMDWPGLPDKIKIDETEKLLTENY